MQAEDPVQGLTLGLAGGLTWGLVGGLALGLTGGGLKGGVVGGMAFLIGFYCVYFRFIFYPVYLIRCMAPLSLWHNPYLRDGVIWLPLPFAARQLSTQAATQPAEGLKFINFLLNERPLQRSLAQHVIHATYGGIWARKPLNVDVLKQIPQNIEKETHLHPSPHWLDRLTVARKALMSSQQQTQISLKIKAFEEFNSAWEAFRIQTLAESPRWNRHYRVALDAWQRAITDKRAQLESEARQKEPITPNVYRPGDVLFPGESTEIFLGRHELKETLAIKILTAPQMPLFLIQGQRRVGKTSLLRFLPTLLGPGFRVAFQDCQDARVSGIVPWEDLQRIIAKTLKIAQPTARSNPNNWLGAWRDFQEWLAALLHDKTFKLILAMDEYEILHGYLQEKPAEGARLLAAMRSFSQQQNQAVFLFCGAAFFSELTNPNWSLYFVQTERLHVDYLKKPDALDLITKPVHLNYPQAVTERLYELTQGHPALLQRICRELVDIANQAGRREMTEADLERALDNSIERETPAIRVFWQEFCRDLACKKMVWTILSNQSPAPSPSLSRLKAHGYIVPAGENWKLRVPLFEQWVHQFGTDAS